MKKILVVPMNWGLGHATRCVPIIRQLMREGNQVFIAGSGESGAWLKQYFPSLKFLHGCPDYGVFYPKKINFFTWLKQWPGFERAISRESKWVNELQEIYQFDIIISDNRFGICVQGCENVFITHQLNPIMPTFFRVLYQAIFWHRMKKFQKIWIPDYPGQQSLSGQLSASSRKNDKVEWKGWLSRFSEVQEKNYEYYDWVGIVSGPEIHRTLFELDLFRKMNASKLKCLLITGEPMKIRNEKKGHVHLLNHLEDANLAYVLKRAKKITSRAGYSSLMDYKVLGVQAEVIATPGQPEQEYLAQRWQNL